MSNAIVWTVLFPVVGAVLAFLFGGTARRLVVWAAVAGTVGSSFVLIWEVWFFGAQRYVLGGWDPPLGISLFVDGFGGFMVIVTAVVGVGVTTYASAYFNGEEEGDTARFFWPLWLFLWAAMNALFLTADVFNAYLAFELIGLSGIALITISGETEALTAAMRYLIVTFLGSLTFLMGISLLYALHGTLDFMLLGEVLQRQPASLAALALILAGMLLKTALVPMHFWLPPAHANAIAPVSAVLSALVVKASYFMLVRLWFTMSHDVVNLEVGILLGVLGSIAIVWGSFRALQATRLKLVVAHSTVAQIGYLFLLFPLITIPEGQVPGDWILEAWTGVSYHVLSHALAKSAMFLAAGAVLRAYGSDWLIDLRGFYDQVPVSTFAFAIAAVSLMGLPPSGGFAAKWLIMKAAIGSGQWWWIPVVMLGGLLAAAYVSVILRYAVQAPVSTRTLRPVPRSMELTALALAMLSILVGFRLEEPFAFLAIGAPYGLDLIP